MIETRMIDGRDMEPPEPLERALAELATLPCDEELVMLLNCEPLPLYAILDRRGYRYRTERRADGSNEVHIQKA
jgi:hypothetical protein